MGRTILGGYRSYKFKEHDPILDQIDRLFEVAGNPTFDDVAADSGVSRGTLSSWYHRKTKRPQFATVKAVVQAVGGELTIVYKGKHINGR